MRVSQDYTSKLVSTEKHDSNFGNLCVKKGGSFLKKGFYLFSNRQWGVDSRTPCAYATDTLGITPNRSLYRVAGPSLRLNAWATQLQRNVAAVATFAPHSPSAWVGPCLQANSPLRKTFSQCLSPRCVGIVKLFTIESQFNAFAQKRSETPVTLYVYPCVISLRTWLFKLTETMKFRCR